MNKLFAAVLLSVLFISACGSIVSRDKYTQYWVGKKIDEKWRSPDSNRKIYQLVNGNRVYVEQDLPGCFIHWEVNPQGFIVGYKLEGNCR